MSWTRLALTAHRWIGLVAGLFLLVQALTGLSLAFRDELSALLQPHAFRTASHDGPLALDRALAQAQARHPHLKIARIDTPARADRVMVVRLGGREDRMLTVHPGGQVLADAPRTDFPVQWLYELHTHFLSGQAGRWVIGLNGLALTVMGVTGLLAWWPGANRLARALKPPVLKGPVFRIVANLHRFTGAYLSLVLVMVGATGLTLVYFEEATKAVAAVLPTASPPKPPKGAATREALVPLSAAVATASAEAPGRPLKSLRFSGAEGRLVRVVFRAEGGHARRIDQVWIDRAGGRVLGVQAAADAPSGARLLGWVLPLHAGEAYGPLARVFGVTAGGALVLFAVSGAWLYARRAWPKPRRAAARP